MRKKVLVAAYACEPDEGSEPGVGWHMCQAISHDHEVWAITRSNNREQIERALAARPNPHLHFAYADLPAWARFWKKGGRFTRTYYYLWQFAALRVARRLHNQIGFDLAHHVTFVNNWMFTFLALLPIPFVWGPLGANSLMPSKLVDNKIILLKDRVRFYYQAAFRLFDPLYWLSISRARLIIGINSKIMSQFPFSLMVKSKFIVHHAIGVEDVFACRHIEEIDGNEFRVLTMGRNLPVKGFELAIRAFAIFHGMHPKSRLKIIGSGFKGSALEGLVREIGISGKVEFIDWLPRTDAMIEMCKADVFLFPTFEGSGMVVLEAMAHELPIAALNFGGPSGMVSSDCAYLVEPGDMVETVNGLALALNSLAQDDERRIRMGKAANARITERYLWKDRHLAINKWYQRINDAHGGRNLA